MRLMVLKIRNGGFFMGPTHWLVDHGTHYDFQLGFVRRRIFKNSIDSFYEFPTGYAVVTLPFIFSVFLLWGLLLVSLKGLLNLMRLLFKL